MRKKLFWKIFAGIALVSALGVGVSALYSQRALRAASATAMTDRLRDVALAISVASAELLPEGRSPALDGLVARTAGKTGVRITLVDGRGTVLADSEQDPSVMENHASRPEIARALGGQVGSSTRYSGTLGRWMVYVAVPLGTAGGSGGSGGRAGAARASAPRAELDAADLRAGGGTAVFASILLVVCLLAALAVSRTIAAPLRDLTGVVRRFAEGDFGARLHLRRQDEVRSLAESFNAMGERVQELFRQNSERAGQLDGIFSSVRQGIVLLDAGDRIIRANRGFEELAGTSAAPGRTLLDVLPVPRLAELVRAARESGSRQSAEIALGERTVLCAVELMAGQGQPLVVLSDTTEIHALETLKRDFVANASHELRTPLTTIAGSLEMLEAEAVGPAADRWIDAIRRNTQRMAAIVEDLLQLSRLEGKAARPLDGRVDVGSVAAEVVALFAHRASQHGIGLRLEAAGPLPGIAGDPHMIEQMLVNLVDNALKYTEAGEVVVSLAAEGGSTIRLGVSDTGIGIAPEHLPRLFERFYVVDASRSRGLGGTGLGLAIVKHIVQAHAGTIGVESTPGRGTRFTVRLPASPAGENSQKTHTILDQS